MDSGNTVLSLLGSLILFILILVLAWFCVRWFGGQFRTGTVGGKLRVLERMPLAPDRSLMVVRIGGQVFLLGVTSQHIEKIAELDPELYPEDSAGPSGNERFAATLETMLKRGFTGGKKENDPNE